MNASSFIDTTLVKNRFTLRRIKTLRFAANVFWFYVVFCRLNCFQPRLMYKDFETKWNPLKRKTEAVCACGRIPVRQPVHVRSRSFSLTHSSFIISFCWIFYSRKPSVIVHTCRLRAFAVSNSLCSTFTGSRFCCILRSLKRLTFITQISSLTVSLGRHKS